MAPPTGLAPVTSWLTVMRSTDWAMEDYTIFFDFTQRFLFRLHKEQSFLLLKSPVVDLNNIFSCSSGLVIVSGTFLYTRTTDWAMEEYRAKHPFGCMLCVGISLSSRAVTSQVFSAPLSLTSVFGMGTGGPSASSTPTILLYLKAFQLFYLLVTRAGIEPALPAWEAGVLTAWPTSLVFRHKG